MEKEIEDEGVWENTEEEDERSLLVLVGEAGEKVKVVGSWCTDSL